MVSEYSYREKEKYIEFKCTDAYLFEDFKRLFEHIYIKSNEINCKRIFLDFSEVVGIIPDIEIKRTIESIKKGNDEILERAIRFARTFE